MSFDTGGCLDVFNEVQRHQYARERGRTQLHGLMRVITITYSDGIARPPQTARW